MADAESTFSKAAFEARLTTAAFGRALVARGECGSTNDVAWELVAAGDARDGLVVVADAQMQGRGRAGRAWHTAPGKGLAVSVLLSLDGAERPVGLAPLAAGLALARALDALGVRADLKWPNDLLIRGRKVAGILTESRAAVGSGARWVVIGAGVNVGQDEDDLPPELRAPQGGSLRPATSLRLEGFTVTREAVAAELFNALEPLWNELETRGREPLLDAWTGRASFWGSMVRVQGPAGTVNGVARALDPEGGLVIELADGGRTTVFAGDVELPAEDARPPLSVRR